MASSLPNTMAYVGIDQRVYSYDLNSGSRAEVTSGLGASPGATAAFDWPVWSPDARSLAFTADTGGEPGLFVARADGSASRRLYQGARPFYLAWSKEGKRIAFLAQAGQGLSTFVVDAEGPAEPRRVLDGQPCYLDWSAGGQDLLVHMGGSVERSGEAYVALISGDGRRTPVGVRPGEFRAASWSPDGRQLLASIHDEQGDAVVTAGDGGVERALARYRGKAAFLWSPRGHQVAMLLSQQLGAPFYEQGLQVVGADGAGRHVLAAGEAVAFSWSPEGDRIAYWQVDRARGRLALVCVDVDSGGRKHIASLAPSQSHLMALTFFDQYALAFSFWSPDGRHLVFSGKALKEQANGTGTPDQDAVYVVPADGSGQPRSVGPGTLGVFPRVIASASTASGA